MSDMNCNPILVDDEKPPKDEATIKCCSDVSFHDIKRCIFRIQKNDGSVFFCICKNLDAFIASSLSNKTIKMVEVLATCFKSDSDKYFYENWETSSNGFVGYRR